MHRIDFMHSFTLQNAFFGVTISLQIVAICGHFSRFFRRANCRVFAISKINSIGRSGKLHSKPTFSDFSPFFLLQFFRVFCLHSVGVLESKWFIKNAYWYLLCCMHKHKQRKWHKYHKYILMVPVFLVIIIFTQYERGKNVTIVFWANNYFTHL